VPSLVRDLDPTPSQLLWIIDIYGFFVAACLMVMGSLGDRLGRRRVLLWGAAAFGLASVVAAFAQTAEQLIAARALLGIAGATVAPSTLSLISNMFRDERERTFAISMWMMAFSIGGIIGPVVGGVMIEWFWWGSVFLLAVPVMVLLLIAGPFLLPEYRDATAGRIDAVSAVMSLLVVLPAIYGVKHAAEKGFDGVALAGLAAGGLMLAAFLRRQRRLEDPFLDLDLFKSTAFSLAVAINALTLFFMFGVWILVAQAFQMVHGLSPLQAGLWSLPSAVAFAAASPFIASLVGRFGRVQVLVWGLVVSGIGLAAMGLAPDLVSFVAAGVVMSLGMTPVFGVTVSIVVGSAPPEKSGVASALSETGAELGAATGIALLGSMMTVIYRAHMAAPQGAGLLEGLSPDLARDAGLSLPGALKAAGEDNIALVDYARVGFENGFTVIALLAGAAMCAIALAAWRVFSGLPPDPLPENPPAH
jgi:DHA2 family multidrug resistance protein-like MFS transporter